MADQKRVELILGIRTEGAVDASAGLDSITKVAAELSGELTKLERGDVLKELGATAAQVAVDINNVDLAAERLAADLKSVGATEAEIRKVSKEFDRVTESLKKEAAALRAADKAQEDLIISQRVAANNATTLQKRIR